MSDLVGNPEDHFSHNKAHLKAIFYFLLYVHGKQVIFVIFHALGDR